MLDLHRKRPAPHDRSSTTTDLEDALQGAHCETPPVEESGRIYGGLSAPERRAQRRRQLFDSGLALFADRGIAALTVSEVCREAGLTKRYFYEQFESINAFIDALMDDLTERLTIAPRGRPGLDRLRDRIAWFVDAVTADPRLARFVLVETFGATGSLGRLRNRLVHYTVEIMIAELPAADGAAHEKRLDVQMSAYALAGASAELMLAWVQGEIAATAAEVTDYLAAFFESATALIGERGQSSPARRDSDSLLGGS